MALMVIDRTLLMRLGNLNVKHGSLLVGTYEPILYVVLELSNYETTCVTHKPKVHNHDVFWLISTKLFKE